MAGFKEKVLKYKAEIGLVVLVIYAITLGIAAADEIFDLGLFPTKLDRMIAESIQNFKSPDPSVRDQAVMEIQQYGDFAVPQLIDALDEQGQTKELALKCLVMVTDQDFGDNMEAWKRWYENHKDEF
jgi:hypothetical protein